MASILTVPNSLEELPAKSSLPWVWFGFVFPIAFLVQETLGIVLELEESVTNLILILIGLAGGIFWLICVHRFHKILAEMSRHHYPITPGEAVWKHFIPFYNLVWLFRWPTNMSDYINQRGRVEMISGTLLGLILLLSALTTRFFDGGFGLLGTFGVGMYLMLKLRRHMELVKGIDPSMLPPPPTQDLFGHAQTKAIENQSEVV
jgi:hypothetical protein